MEESKVLSSTAENRNPSFGPLKIKLQDKRLKMNHILFCIALNMMGEGNLYDVKGL